MVTKRARKRNAQKKTWKELSPMAKFGTISAALVQLSMLVAAQRDITRRPAEQIRGSKTLWRMATLVNFVGPGSYFTFGVKRGRAAK
ncbi:hypothetical protein [Arthrobacter sp. Leaf69]|uniref:hypothetical protein n=1 Tax=Arthrobacter sp. Leaf69 TaxID=1736232 RepID=UPI0006FE36E4|nr:hypothetical protein [Arthrobacter sp. Leaf69]KQN94774.1 hypothetical protein ASE96_00795 [Arthrobacter sp. Leaf69]